MTRTTWLPVEEVVRRAQAYVDAARQTEAAAGDSPRPYIVRRILRYYRQARGRYMLLLRSSGYSQRLTEAQRAAYWARVREIDEELLRLRG